MFEQLTDRHIAHAAEVTRQQALSNFSAQETEHSENQFTEAFIRECGQVLRALEDHGKQLDMPKVAEELSRAISLNPQHKDAKADCTPFTWVPEVAATKSAEAAKSATEWPTETRAIMGWSITWPGSNLRESAVLLFQQGNEFHLNSPQVAVLTSNTVLGTDPSGLNIVRLSDILVPNLRIEQAIQLNGILTRALKISPDYDDFFGNYSPEEYGDERRTIVIDGMHERLAVEAVREGTTEIELQQDILQEMYYAVHIHGLNNLSAKPWVQLRLHKLFLEKRYSEIAETLGIPELQSGKHQRADDYNFLDLTRLLGNDYDFGFSRARDESFPQLGSPTRKSGEKPVYDVPKPKGPEQDIIENALLLPHTVKKRRFKLLTQVVECPKNGGIIGNRAEVAILECPTDTRETVARQLEAMYLLSA